MQEIRGILAMFIHTCMCGVCRLTGKAKCTRDSCLSPAGELKGHADRALCCQKCVVCVRLVHWKTRGDRRSTWEEAVRGNVRLDILRWSVSSRRQVTSLCFPSLVAPWIVCRYSKDSSWNSYWDTQPMDGHNQTSVSLVPRLINWLADMSRIHHSWQFYY